MFIVAWFAVVFGAPSTAPAAPPPEPPLPVGACACFEGTTHGNDDVTARLRLCHDLEGITGVFRWVGTRSGLSERALAGAPVSGGVQLRDLKLTIDRPNPGWRFCPVDRYDLQWTATGGLTGSFWSSACADRAELALDRATDDRCPEGERPGT
ncbi:MAG: hypothetical protein ABMB14_18265 [Myxococcota bacterium]